MWKLAHKRLHWVLLHGAVVLYLTDGKQMFIIILWYELVGYEVRSGNFPSYTLFYYAELMMHLWSLYAS